MSGNKKHRTANEILKYLRGETSDRERYDLERQMESDPFEKEAMEGLESLTPEQTEEDILALHARLRKRLARRRRITLYSAAATVASLLIIGTIFLQIYDFNPKKEQGALSEEEIPVISRDKGEPGEAAAGEEKAEAPVKVEKDRISTLSDADKHVVPEEKRAAEPVKTEVPARPVESGKPRVSEIPGEKTETAGAAGSSKKVPDVEEVPGLGDEIVAVEAAESAGADMDVKAEDRALEVQALDETREAADHLAVEAAQPAAQSQYAAAPKTSGRKMAVTRAKFAEPVSGEIKGVVLSAEDMDPLPGAVVYQKERDTGVVTDMQGRFSFPAEADATTTLVASFVGMEPGEYPVKEGSEVKLVLQPDQSSLNESVMIGYADGTTYRSGENQIFTYPVSGQQKASHISARPVIGYEAFSRYIEENLRFPSRDTVNDRAVVVLQFTVTSGGKIRDIQPLRTPGKSFTREASRLVNEGPPWNPATGASGATDEVVRLRILFKR